MAVRGRRLEDLLRLDGGIETFREEVEGVIRRLGFDCVLVEHGAGKLGVSPPLVSGTVTGLGTRPVFLSIRLAGFRSVRRALVELGYNCGQLSLPLRYANVSLTGIIPAYPTGPRFLTFRQYLKDGDGYLRGLIGRVMRKVDGASARLLPDFPAVFCFTSFRRGVPQFQLFDLDTRVEGVLGHLKRLLSR